MLALGRQHAAFADETARFFMDVDLTMAQFRALATLRRWGRQTGRELAQRLRVTPGTLVPLIDRLEELGYLRRVPDRTDRRLIVIRGLRLPIDGVALPSDPLLLPNSSRDYRGGWHEGPPPGGPLPGGAPPTP